MSASTTPRSDDWKMDYTAAKGGIGVGLLVLFFLIGFSFIWWWITRRREPQDIEGEHHSSNGPIAKFAQEVPRAMGTTPTRMEQRALINNTAPRSDDLVAASSTPPFLSYRNNGVVVFTFEQLSSATVGFADGNILGQGGFGPVHKGILPNGREVAVKRLKMSSGQGESQFDTEIDIINRVHHRNLVSLIGYCRSGEERLLVYELVPNKTLEHHLHDEGAPLLGWDTRLQIAIGAAKGLSYLHHEVSPRIIHRDVKSSNLLLDSTFNVKVSDFGLAKLYPDQVTHVTATGVVGTFGHMDPEYQRTLTVTEKSDVFSFAVVLLELITGRPAIFEVNSSPKALWDWAKSRLKSEISDGGDFITFVDPRLQKNYNPKELAKMAVCAAYGIQDSSRNRPTMKMIVEALERSETTLEDLKQTMVDSNFSLE